MKYTSLERLSCGLRDTCLGLFVLAVVSCAGNSQRIPANPIESAHCEVGGKILAIPAKEQETDVWCSAASVQEVLEYFNMPVPQCMIVNEIILSTGVSTHSTCCENSLLGNCQINFWPSVALRKFGVQYRKIETQGDPKKFLAWAELTQQICLGRPVIYVAEFTAGGRHSFIAMGYKIDKNGNRFVQIHDHFTSQATLLTYEEFLHGMPEGGSYTPLIYYLDLVPITISTSGEGNQLSSPFSRSRHQ